ncbi:DUF6399 domain-containing protein, partial [uncultured Thiocystis sp.]|uniref:DUF6399 domain-containing protein n=1 Tax=uncultured Thiocystis sp. TaxID=1202134 RepID=UPI0025F435E7
MAADPLHAKTAILALFCQAGKTRGSSLTQLIPALYLEQAAARCARAEPRQRRQAISAQLLAPLQQPTHPVQQPPPDERAEIEQVATDCATLFQR